MIVKFLELKDLIKKLGDKYWIYIKILVKFNAEITEETTARDFLEIAYIYIWETENQ